MKCSSSHWHRWSVVLGVAIALALPSATMADAATIDLTTANQIVTPGSTDTATVTPESWGSTVSTNGLVYVSTNPQGIGDGVVPNFNNGSTLRWTMPASFPDIPFGSLVYFTAYYGAQGEPFPLINSEGGPELWTTTAPAVTQSQVSPGTALGTVKIKAVPDASDTFAVATASSSVATPYIGTALPTTARSYASGTNISGLKAGDYIALYEVNGSGKIQAFSQWMVSSSDINAAPPWTPPTLDPVTLTINGHRREVIGSLGYNAAEAIQNGSYAGYVEERAALNSGARYSGEGTNSAYLSAILDGSGVGSQKQVSAPLQGQFAALYQKLGIIPTWTNNTVSIPAGVSRLLTAGASRLAIENYLVQMDGFSWSAADMEANGGFPIQSHD